MDALSPVGADRRKSCDLCCSRKRRCDGDGVNPCTLCSTKGVLCAYSKKGRRGPKPKPKRDREGDGTYVGELEEGGTVLGEDGRIPSVLDWVGGQQDGAQPRSAKMPRMGDVVRLTPSPAMGMLGLKENGHLNAFFNGFGACTQIVQEDEIRGAMIYVLSEGQFGMPGMEEDAFSSPKGFFSTGSDGKAASAAGRQAGGDSYDGSSLKLIRLDEGGLGIAAEVSSEAEGGGSEKGLKQRAQRARLSAGVACLWAGIGVGAMLRGQTAEATAHYAENAREAIKGCYDVVSEEVLRAFLCLAHMHSFREDFPKFFRYTAMANDVAASLDRQGVCASAGKLRPSGRKGPASKGCSEPAKFLLKCFDAMSHFLELEGEEANSPIEGIIAPQLIHGPSSGKNPGGLASQGSEGCTSSESSSDAGEGGGGKGSNRQNAAAAEANKVGGESRQKGAGGGARTAHCAAAAAAAAAAGLASAAAAASSQGSGAARAGDGDGDGGVGESDDWPQAEVARMAVDVEKADSARRTAADGGSQGDGGASDVIGRWIGRRGDDSQEEAARRRGKENEPRELSANEVSTLTLKAKVAGALRSNPSALAYDEFPGLKSAVRVQECISVLGDNPVAKRLGNFALSSINAVGQGKSQSRGGASRPSEEAIAENDNSSSSSLKFPPLKTNQVLFVGDTRILEVSMGVDCSCISVMCKVVAGVPWKEVQADAQIVANTADAILVPVLASPSISRSVCAVKLLANSAFSHLCLGNGEHALRAVRRFSAILKEFPGIVRFPPWRHCFHWMAGMLEAADLRNLYEGLRTSLNAINMKSMRDLPEFGEGAHDVMCKCSHFRCQATHRALAEHARRDPFGAFHTPRHCPQFGACATAAAANGSNTTTFRAGQEASEWAAKLHTVDSRSSGGVGIVGPGAGAATASAASDNDTTAVEASTQAAMTTGTGPSAVAVAAPVAGNSAAASAGPPLRSAAAATVTAAAATAAAVTAAAAAAAVGPSLPLATSTAAPQAVAGKSRGRSDTTVAGKGGLGAVPQQVPVEGGGWNNMLRAGDQVLAQGSFDTFVQASEQRPASSLGSFPSEPENGGGRTTNGGPDALFSSAEAAASAWARSTGGGGGGGEKSFNSPRRHSSLDSPADAAVTSSSNGDSISRGHSSYDAGKIFGAGGGSVSRSVNESESSAGVAVKGQSWGVFNGMVGAVPPTSAGGGGEKGTVTATGTSTNSGASPATGVAKKPADFNGGAVPGLVLGCAHLMVPGLTASVNSATGRIGVTRGGIRTTTAAAAVAAAAVAPRYPVGGKSGAATGGEGVASLKGRDVAGGASGGGAGITSVSGGFVGGSGGSAGGGQGATGGAAAGGAAAGLGVAGYSRDNQQLWEELCGGPDSMASGMDIEISDAALMGGQEGSVPAEEEFWAQDIVGMLSDETKAC